MKTKMIITILLVNILVSSSIAKIYIPPSVYSKVSAINEIESKKDTTKISYLTSIISNKNQNPLITIAAMDALGEIGNRNTIPLLKQILNNTPSQGWLEDDFSPQLRISAGKAICNIEIKAMNTKESVKYLADRIRKYGIKPGVGAGAQRLIISHVKVWSEEILPLMKDTNPRVRGTVISALIKHPEIKAKDALKEALIDSDNINRANAAHALEKLGVKTRKINDNYEYEILSE